MCSVQQKKQLVWMSSVEIAVVNAHPSSEPCRFSPQSSLGRRDGETAARRAAEWIHSGLERRVDCDVEGEDLLPEASRETLSLTLPTRPCDTIPYFLSYWKKGVVVVRRGEERDRARESCRRTCVIPPPFCSVKARLAHEGAINSGH